MSVVTVLILFLCVFGCVRVRDRLEKEDKCAAASETNDFIQQTALRIF